MWLAHTAKELNSYVTSLDTKCDRVRRAQEVLKEVGLSENTEVLCADAGELQTFRARCGAVIYRWEEE